MEVNALLELTLERSKCHEQSEIVANVFMTTIRVDLSLHLLYYKCFVLKYIVTAYFQI